MTGITCESIIAHYTKDLGSRFSCHWENGELWIVSPFTYPDNDLVEISVRELRAGQVLVSDLGETLRHLANQGFDPQSTEKGGYLLAEIAKQHDVDLDRGMISRRVVPNQVGAAIQDVLAACLGVSHLIFLSRGIRPATFQEEVAHLLSSEAPGFRQGHQETGRLSGKVYSIDFFIPGQEKDGLVQALSASTLAASTAKVNATFRLWSDIPNGRWRATLLDDRLFEWRYEDRRILKQVSDVYRWQERESFLKDLHQMVLGSYPGPHHHRSVSELD